MPYPQCNHIMSDGMKCKSPALKRQSYCYFHHRYNLRQRRRVQLGGPVGTNQNTGIELPVIESWETIQIAIQEILESIIDSRVDPKRAGLMLYALQLASTNLKMMKYPGISQPNGVTELPEDMEEQEYFGAPRLPQFLERRRLAGNREPAASEQSRTGTVPPSIDVESTTDLGASESLIPTTTPDSALKGHGFSRAETTPSISCHSEERSDEESLSKSLDSAAPPLPQSANVGTTNLKDVSLRGGRQSDEGSAAPSTTPEPSTPTATPDSALKGHGFSRVETDAKENGALAPEVAKPDDPIPDDLRLRYPGQPDAHLMRLIPQPNDDDTRAYYKPYDSVKRRDQIRKRRHALGLEPLESRI